MPTVSLKTLVCALIVVAAALAAAAAFVPMHRSAQRSVRSCVDSIRAGATERVEHGLSAGMREPVLAAQSIQRAVHKGIVNAKNVTQLLDYVIELSTLQNGTLASVLVAQTDFSFALSERGANGRRNAGGKSACCGGPIDVPSCCPLVLGEVDATPFANTIRYDSTAASISTAHLGIGYFASPTQYVVGYPYWEASSRTSVIGHSAWTKSSRSASGTFQLSFTASLHLPPTAEYIGQASAALDVGWFNTLLRSIGLTDGTRAMVFTPAHDALRSPHVTQRMLDARQTVPGTVLGISWQHEHTQNSDGDGLTLRDLANFTDKLSQRVYQSLGRHALLARATPFTWQIGSGRRRATVDVGHVRDAYGLNLRFWVVVPDDDFVQDVYQHRTIAIVGAACAVVAMCLLSVLIVHHTLAAINRVTARMADSGPLEDNALPETPKSSVTEVRRLQQSYESLRREQDRVKVFLPPAARNQILTESAGDGLGELDREASIRVVGPWQGGAGNPLAWTPPTPRSPSNLDSLPPFRSSDITVAFVRIRGFYDVLERMGPEAGPLQVAHHAFMAAVEVAASAHQGVVDSFHGDHVVLTFNATRRCMQHAKQASLAVLQLLATMEASPNPLRHLSVGIATGRALFGTLGTPSMQQLCVFGRVHAQAAALQEMALAYGTSVLASAAVIDEIHLVVYYEILDLIAIPHGKTPAFVATFSKPRVAANDSEWMYQIQHSDDEDPYSEVNEAFRAYRDGDADAARELVQKAKHQRRHDTHLGLPILEKKLAC